ncbi:MAG: hypothetical protein HN623_11215, partial [Bdellovibrionales bacterium]|nr:hypothetical protein [Bdellovibrionales bacterium]
MSELIKMKQGLLITSLVLVVLLITGCMPAAPNGERRSSSEAEVTPDTTANSGSTTTSNSGEVLYWYSSAQKVTGTITLNADQQDIVYLRGDAIHNFLINNSNYQNTYCLVVNFNESGMKQLRARATPISFNNFNTGMLERLFRIDLPSKSANQASCDGTIDSTITGAGAFILSDICLTCTTKANSSTINLYESIGGINDLSVIPRTTLDISSIGMRVDLSSNSSSVISQCTNSSCSAKGFDCCLSGQCVNDAALKPNASSESNYYQAVADVTSDPNQFIHYPNVYFICGHHVVPTPVDPTPVNPEEEANARLATKVKQYKCLKGYPSTTPYSNCEHTECATNGNSDCFDEVRKQIWIECGCEKTPTPDDPDNYYCPDLSLRAYDAADELIDQIISSSTFSKVECDIPANDADPAPFQKLNVTVPGNSAPHRFFCKSDGGTNCSAGEAVDDINTISGQDIEPEGAEFFYLDPDAQIDPINGSFNINHILGQFSTTLTEAKPAKVVTVEFNQAYVISTTTGYYTPCPSCAKDSWYDNFSSFPVSRMGVGLQNIGYTTKRDRYNSNTTHGNYEDTIFGRACFVPPTMIPFSHTPNSDLATQRENRLATQTALFVNGYQRDWYGFNLGALIGSFDG